MKVKEITTNTKQWMATIKIKNPQYVGYVDVSAWAPNSTIARQIIKSQNRIEDWEIVNIRQVK